MNLKYFFFITFKFFSYWEKPSLVFLSLFLKKVIRLSYYNKNYFYPHNAYNKQTIKLKILISLYMYTLGNVSLLQKQIKSMTTMGLEPSIFRFVAGRLIHWATRPVYCGLISAFINV